MHHDDPFRRLLMPDFGQDAASDYFERQQNAALRELGFHRDFAERATREARQVATASMPSVRDYAASYLQQNGLSHLADQALRVSGIHDEHARLVDMATSWRGDIDRETMAYSEQARLIEMAAPWRDKLVEQAMAFSGPAQRSMESARDLMPTIESMNLLGYVLWDGASVADSHWYLSDLVGDLSFDATDALSRAGSLRVRKGLYKELGADLSIERVRPEIARTALVARARQDRPKSSILQVIEARNPLLKARMECFATSSLFEGHLRLKVSMVMTNRFGVRWLDENVDLAKLRKKVCHKYEEKNGLGSARTAGDLDLLQFSDFADLRDLVLEYFHYDSDQRDELLDSFAIVIATRNSVCHGHPVLVVDEVKVKSIMVSMDATLRLDDIEYRGATH